MEVNGSKQNAAQSSGIFIGCFRRLDQARTKGLLGCCVLWRWRVQVVDPNRDVDEVHQLGLGPLLILEELLLFVHGATLRLASASGRRKCSRSP